MCVYLFSLLQYTWDRILKKEIVKAERFESTALPLWVRDLTASANPFQKHKVISNSIYTWRSSRHIPKWWTLKLGSI